MIGLNTPGSFAVVSREQKNSDWVALVQVEI